jgi:hypothetical protein
MSLSEVFLSSELEFVGRDVRGRRRLSSSEVGGVITGSLLDEVLAG